MAAPICAQHVPIPTPISMSEAAIAATGPEPIVTKSPANPAAVRSGPSMITVRDRTGETRALRSVPVVHERDRGAEERGARPCRFGVGDRADAEHARADEREPPEGHARRAHVVRHGPGQDAPRERAGHQRDRRHDPERHAPEPEPRQDAADDGPAERRDRPRAGDRGEHALPQGFGEELAHQGVRRSDQDAAAETLHRASSDDHRHARRGGADRRAHDEHADREEAGDDDQSREEERRPTGARPGGGLHGRDIPPPSAAVNDRRLRSQRKSPRNHPARSRTIGASARESHAAGSLPWRKASLIALSSPHTRWPVSESTRVMTMPGGGVNGGGGALRIAFTMTSAQIGSAMSAPVSPIERASSVPTHTPTTRSGV